MSLIKWYNKVKSSPTGATNKKHKPFTSNSLGFFVLVFSRHVDYKLLK
jgi:hypothetical protein